MQALLFDLDGTLVNSGDDLVDTVNHTLGILDLPVLDKDEILSYVGDGVQMLVKRSIKASPRVSEISIDDALDIFLSYYKENCTVKTKEYPGVSDALTLLSKDYQLAVLTNKGQALAEIIITNLNLKHFFKTAVGGDTLPVRKPDPIVMQHISDVLDVNKSEMLMIGDHHTDLMAAENINIPSVFCDFGMGHTDGVVPTATISHFSELPKVIENIVSTKDK